MSTISTLTRGEVRPGGPAACGGTAAKSGGPAGSRSDKKQRHVVTIPRIACNITRGIEEIAE